MQSASKPTSIFPTHQTIEWIKLERPYQRNSPGEINPTPLVKVGFQKGLKQKSGKYSIQLAVVLNTAMMNILGWQVKDKVIFYQHPENAHHLMAVKSQTEGFKIGKSGIDRFQITFTWTSTPVDPCAPFLVDHEIIMSEPKKLTFWFKI